MLSLSFSVVFLNNSFLRGNSHSKEFGHRNDEGKRATERDFRTKFPELEGVKRGENKKRKRSLTWSEEGRRERRGQG